MLIETQKSLKLFKRESKLGVIHNYRRHKIVYVLKCNGCKIIFKITRSKPDKIKQEKKHFCGKCKSKC